MNGVTQYCMCSRKTFGVPPVVRSYQEYPTQQHTDCMYNIIAHAIIKSSATLQFSPSSTLDTYRNCKYDCQSIRYTSRHLYHRNICNNNPQVLGDIWCNRVNLCDKMSQSIPLTGEDTNKFKPIFDRFVVGNYIDIEVVETIGSENC